MPWLRCEAPKWCADIGDRISASLINRKLPYLFKEGAAGMILTPNEADIRCSYFADGGTMPKRCGPDAVDGCIPGCCDVSGKPNWCTDVRIDSQTVYQCAFRPSDLDAMMRHHEIRPGSYNEVIVDPTRWGASTTQAFYFVQGASGAEDFARDVHRRFHEHYGLGTRSVPLVRLELQPPQGHPALTRVA